MLDYIVNFFLSFYANPSGLGIGLAFAFGIIWLVGYWPPLVKKYWLWAVLVSGGILAWVAASFIQIPLQIWVGNLLGRFWSGEVLISWILLASIPQVLLSGLVQEGAKMLPMVAWFGFSRMRPTPRMGLMIGAMAGAGLGILEAQWVHNSIFASGWTLDAIQTNGVIAVAGFWERFFVVGMHVAVSSLAGYGLAKGMGWQFYLIASGIHALINYGAVLLQAGVFGVIQMEIYAAVLALAVTGVALWLRWRKTPESEEYDDVDDYPSEDIDELEQILPE